MQGNTLVGPQVIKTAFAAALKTQKDSLPIEEILMQAWGGRCQCRWDKRCGQHTASSAFLIVSKPEYIDKHWLELVATKEDDFSPAVQTLRKKFDN